MSPQTSEPQVLDRAPEYQHPTLPSGGRQVIAANIDPTHPEYAFIQTDGGVYWVFRNVMGGQDVADSGIAFSSVHAAALNAGEDAVRRQLDTRILLALNGVAELAA